MRLQVCLLSIGPAVNKQKIKTTHKLLFCYATHSLIMNITEASHILSHKNQVITPLPTSICNIIPPPASWPRKQHFSNTLSNHNVIVHNSITYFTYISSINPLLQYVVRSTHYLTSRSRHFLHHKETFSLFRQVRKIVRSVY